jgi:hypothetical protein
MSAARSIGHFSVSTTGGFAPIPSQAAGRVVHFDCLSDADLDEIRSATSSADFFTRSASVPSPLVRDGRLHSVAITLDGRSRTLVVPDPFEDQPIADLVRSLRRIAARRRPDEGDQVAGAEQPSRRDR